MVLLFLHGMHWERLISGRQKVRFLELWWLLTPVQALVVLARFALILDFPNSMELAPPI